MSAISNFVNAVCEVLNTNCNSLITENANANVWSKSTLDIGDAWLNVDPTAQNDLQKAIAALLSGKLHLKDFFNNLNNKMYPLPQWSMDLVSQLQGIIASDDPTKNPDDKDLIPIWNGTVSQYASLIQSTSGQNTSTGDAENKACQSALQNASSAGQPATNAGDSMIGLLSNGSSVQAQISA
jgi:hypothetical protein